MKNYPLYTQKVHYRDLREVHQSWFKELDFFKEEIHFFQALLKDYVIESDGSVDRNAVKNLQFKFIQCLEQIDIYLKGLTYEENRLNDFINIHLSTTEFISFGGRKEWRNKITFDRKFYLQLKREFFQTITKKN